MGPNKIVFLKTHTSFVRVPEYGAAAAVNSIVVSSITYICIMRGLVNSIKPTGKLGAEQNNHLKAKFSWL